MTIQETLALTRTAYSGPISAAQAVDILNRTAWIHRADGWGLLEAPPGGNGAAHPSGRRVRLDILMHQFTARIYDVFIDGPDAIHETTGRAEPSWGEKGLADPSRFVAPTPPADVTLPGTPLPPEPAPAPAPPAEDLRTVLEVVTLILADVTAIRKMLGALADDVTDLGQQPVKWPTYTGTVAIRYLGTAPIRLEPES